jgi:hypothetical protein
VVSSEEGDPLWVLDLQAEQIFEGFNGVIASINKISNEDVAGLLNFSS